MRIRERFRRTQNAYISDEVDLNLPDSEGEFKNKVRYRWRTDFRPWAWDQFDIGDLLWLFGIDLAHVSIFFWRMTAVIQMAP